MYLLSWLKLMVFTCCVCHRTPHILQPLDVTPHILQPLDITTFKSCKTNFSKACSTYLATNPERVVTTDKLALLVVEAWPSSFTPVNIMSGFKKCGVFLLNPSEVSDRQTAPSKTFCQQNCKTGTALTESENPLFSPEKRSTVQETPQRRVWHC